MAKIKSYTDFFQSKVLTEFLPLESADMWWNFYSVTTDDTTPQIIHLDTPWVGNFNWDNKPDNVPCWSLAALLNVLPEGVIENYYTPNIQKENGKYSIAYGNEELLCVADNPIDACVEMILKLHELNLL